MFAGRLKTLTHDYKRNGTTTLFAAIELAGGRIIADCMPRHRHQEWIKFLKKIDAETPPDLDLHLIVDNYATHKHPKVKNWLRRHKRFHVHFTPTSSSWLNVIERWFRADLSERPPIDATKSYQAFATLVQRFPNSQYAADSRQRMIFLRNRLASYETYVANYYLTRGAYAGAINRAKYAIENYDGAPAVRDALAIMSESSPPSCSICCAACTSASRSW